MQAAQQLCCIECISRVIILLIASSSSRIRIYLSIVRPSTGQVVQEAQRVTTQQRWPARGNDRKKRASNHVKEVARSIEHLRQMHITWLEVLQSLPTLSGFACTYFNTFLGESIYRACTNCIGLSAGDTVSEPHGMSSSQDKVAKAEFPGVDC